jgi:hypothetical protein
MAEADLKFWDLQFPDKDERRTLALEDEDIQIALRKTSPKERVVSGDDLLSLERLAAERYGLDPLETSRLLEEFWGLRDIESRNYYGGT